MLNHKPVKTVTIEDVGELIKNWYRLILNNKIKFSLLFMIGATLGFFYAHFFNQIQYVSRLTFVLDKQTTDPLEEGSLRYTGVNVSGNPSVKLMNGDNLQLILQSDKMIKEALLYPIGELNGNNLLTVFYKENLFILNEKIKDNTLKEAIRKIKKRHLHIGKLADMGSFYFMEVNHENELFCYYFPEVLMKSLLTFYEKEKSNRLQGDIETLRMLVFSIKKEIYLVKKEQNLKKNQFRNLVFFEDKILLENITKSSDELELRLKENQKILDIAQFQQSRKTTFLNIIDRPFLPLLYKGKSRVKFGFFFGFLTFFIAFIILQNKK